MSHSKQWNSIYLSGCVQQAIGLLNTSGVATDLLKDAAEHLDCTEKYDCRFYRLQLKRKVAQLRRERGIQPWEYWLLAAAEQILHPIPGTKHGAVTMLRSAIDEYDQNLIPTWKAWHEQYALKEPAYV